MNRQGPCTVLGDLPRFLVSSLVDYGRADLEQWFPYLSI